MLRPLGSFINLHRVQCCTSRLCPAVMRPYLVGTFLAVLITTACTEINRGPDVIFVVDSSDRIGQVDFNALKDWIQALTEYWQLGPLGVQVSVVTYGNGAYLNFALCGDYQMVTQQIGALKFRGGTADAATGIQEVLDSGFNPTNGARVDRIKVIIHVGAGTDKDPSAYQSVIQTAVYYGIRVYNIYVGQTMTKTDLQGSTSIPESRYLFTVDYGTLGDMMLTLAQRIKTEIPSPDAVLRKPSNCITMADIAVVLDGSKSATAEDFIQLKDLLNGLVINLPISKTDVQFALLQYGSRTRLEIKFGQLSDRLSVMNHIQQVESLGGGTRTELALKYLRQTLFTPQNGARPGALKIALVITDGHAPSISKTINEAIKARNIGVQFVVVGIGPRTSQAEMKGIAANDANIIQVESFEDLETSSNDLMSKFCGVVTSFYATTTMPTAVLTTTDNPWTPTPQLVECRDTLPEKKCKGYIKLNKGFCQIRRYQRISRQCSKSCEFCIPIPRCLNKWNNCTDFNPQDCLSPSFHSFFAEGCKQFCGFCKLNELTSGFHGKCMYGGKMYKQGEKWNDGCDYECTCTDGRSGKYECKNRCPVLYDIPSMCTFVRKKGECCLQPVCNFNGTLQIGTTSQKALDQHGNDMCLYNGTMYGQGDVIQDDCTSKCQCTDASKGLVTCHDACPTYDVQSLPSNCYLQNDPAATCCQYPKCSFNNTVGGFGGFGSVSGTGVGRKPFDPTAIDKCKDLINDCSTYTKDECQDTKSSPYMTQNCPVYCGLCAKKFAKPQPGNMDKCYYQGVQYKTGDVWQPDCQHTCVCDDELYGYYRCFTKCPKFTKVPQGCNMTKNGSTCCPELVCPGNYSIVSSTTNIRSIGSGGFIYRQADANGGPKVPVLPKVFENGTLDKTTVTPKYPPIAGCLYNNHVLVQGEIMQGSNCGFVCQCVDASDGKLVCHEKCRQYLLHPSCKMVNDTTEPCCYKPDCTSPGTQPKLVPRKPKIMYSLVEMPDPSTLISITGLPVTTTAAPTTKSYCIYQGSQYPQGSTWLPSCKEKCTCDNVHQNVVTCTPRCPKYLDIPSNAKCVERVDPRDPCCRIPECVVSGHGVLPDNPLLIPPVFPRGAFQTIAAPGTGYCEYNGKAYKQDEEWAVDCDFICTCIDQLKGKTECLERCVHYDSSQLSPFCFLTTDPSDTCCQVAKCEEHVMLGQLTGPDIPDVYSTLSPKEKPENASRCYVNGTFYFQGNEWFEGCSKRCRCEDAVNNIRTCEDRCPQVSPQPGCDIVADPHNVCCKVPLCHLDPDLFSGLVDPYLIPSLAPRTFTGEPVSPKPTADFPGNNKTNRGCLYKGEKYAEGDSWYDGCDWMCRCINASLGTYHCTDRCARFPKKLPSQCSLVSIPGDFCCQELDCSEDKDRFTIPLTLPGTGSTQTPLIVPTLPNGNVFVPPIVSPVTCQDGDNVYTAGQIWFIGCHLRCVCAQDGTKICESRCRLYKRPVGNVHCTLKPDPQDALCCSIPECHSKEPTKTPPAGPRVLEPVAPPGHIIGYAVSPTKLPEVQDPLHPNPSTTSKCTYNGLDYAENEKWQVGCKFTCSCTDAAKREYTCYDMCPSYPVPSPPDCVSTRDVNNPCCMVPFCPRNNNKNITSGMMLNATTTISPPQSKCKYKNIMYQQGEVWRDGCDFSCTCDDSATGKIRCNRMCKNYVDVDQSSCVWMTDPSNQCCRYPKCEPSTATASTPGPSVPKVAYPVVPVGFVVGYKINPLVENSNNTNKCEYLGGEYNTGDRWTSGGGLCGKACECLDGQSGQYRCKDRCPLYEAKDLPFYCRLEADPKDRCCQHPVCDLQNYPGLLPSPNPIDEQDFTNKYCIYMHKLYLENQRWNDGCQSMCQCVNVENKLVPVCEGRCLKYDSISAGCTMVADPSDAECCKIASCSPSIGTDGRLAGNTTKPFIVTGTRGYKYGYIPQQNKEGKNKYCLYKGQTYTKGQSWIDGCQRQCSCVDQTKGRYKCQDRCPSFTHVPPQCTLQQDLDNICCQKLSCDPSKSISNPYMVTTPQTVDITTKITPSIDPTAARPIPTSAPKPVPRPLPLPQTTTAMCTFNGAFFKQFEEFNLNCERRCRCEAPDTNHINCFNRCPIYSEREVNCDLMVDPKDSCCQVRKCVGEQDSVSVVTPSPPPGNGTTTKAPEKVQVPMVIPGGVTFIQRKFQHFNRGVCVYKGKHYKDQEIWNDGCGVNCTCLDTTLGTVRCQNKCPQHIDIPDNCFVEKDSMDCCDKVTCYAPGIIPTIAPPPSGSGGHIFSSLFKPVPSGHFCMYKGIKLTEGQVYFGGNCEEKCVCANPSTNHVSCVPRCLNYTSATSQSFCQLVPDSRDPQCCKVPKCKVQDRRNPYGVIGKYIATADPFPAADNKSHQDGCFIKGQRYTRGQSWKEQCEICTCTNPRNHVYECTSLCPSYPDLPAGCRLRYDRWNPCCPKPRCRTIRKTTYCTHNGLPYKQGELIKTGDCSMVLRCEDSKTNTISQRDRCPKYTHSKPGCHLETSPKDSCCQILVCQNPDSDDPLTIITTLSGTISGTSILKIDRAPTAKGAVGCFVNNNLYRQGESWKEGCSMVCTCNDGNKGRFSCMERCPAIPASLPPTCRLVPDARDECCSILSCVPPQFLIPSVVTATHTPIGSSNNSNGISYLKPPVKGVCVYKNQYYRELQSWYEGQCGRICVCEDAARGIVQCREVCPRIVNASSECLLVPDPRNPQCCKVEDCPRPPTAAPPIPGYFWNSVPPRIIYGKPDITNSFVPGANGSYDLQGCRYNGKIYQANESFDDGCDLRCSCLNATSGEYRCRSRCPTFLPRKECVLVHDPTDICCKAQYCDFTNAKPFPKGLPDNVTLIHPHHSHTPGPYEVAGIQTTPRTPTTPGPQDLYLGFCMYEGSKYIEGQTWTIGCEKTCTCVIVTFGLYSCRDRCLSFGNRAPNCVLRPDPADSCCLVQDCAPSFVDPVYPVTSSPNQTSMASPNITVNPGEVILRPGNPASYIRAVSGPPGYYKKNNYINCYLEDEREYSQGSRWQEGNDLCTCVDAASNRVQCQHRCASYYFLPPSCRMVPNPSDPPCLLAVCPNATVVSPLPVTAAKPVPTIAVRPTQPQTASKIKNCLVSGFSHPKGLVWSDGCQSCECINPDGNVYQCHRRCPVYTALPSYCTMVTDVNNTCCRVPSCKSNGVSLTAVVGKGDNITGTNDDDQKGPGTIPFPTHPVLTGSGHPPDIAATLLKEYGGSGACYYNGQLYRPGESWDEGCDLTCACETKSRGTWTCVQRCGELPSRLPSYCHLVKVPGQCCKTLSCDIPRVGHYHPPMTVYTVKPGQVPEAVPGDVTFLYPWPPTGVISVPGNGYTLTSSQQIAKIKNRCVRHNRAYTQGQKWNEGCNVLCECIDEVTGYYHCTNQCPSYHIPVPHCVMKIVPGQCCKQLICNDHDTGATYDPILHPRSNEYIYGVVKPGFSGFRPGYVPQGVSNQFVGCYFQWQYYLQGEKWESGCGLQCTCVDGQTHLIECHDVCHTFTNVPSACSLTSDSHNRCCQSVTCPASDNNDLVVPTKSHRPVFNISEGSCIDTIDDCESYTLGSCGPQYATWAKDRCPRYCGLCYDTSLLAPACEDMDEECDSLGQNACGASDTKMWMWKNCHKTCGYCDSCLDVSDWCVNMKSSSCHGVWEPWAKLMCAKTCNFCSDVTPTLTVKGSGEIPEGWLVLLKGVTGVPLDLYSIWANLGSLNADNTQAQDLTTAFQGHFKSFYADRFYECHFKKIRVAVYKNGVEKASITFNAINTNKLSWFNETRIESSTWVDMMDSAVHLDFKNEDTNVFFEVANASWSSCVGQGWMFVSTRGIPCNNHNEFNGFYYSSQDGVSTYNAMEKGDVFAIMAQGGDCNTSNPIPLYCPYLDHAYLVGEEWNIGCSKKCKCTEENSSPAIHCKPYVCETFKDIRPGCKVVKKPDECCASLVGPTCHGEPLCWDENTNRTHADGDTWRVGCHKYMCTKVKEGYQTSAISVCPSWNLSGLNCILGKPRPGKCCALPICPDIGPIGIPDKYKDDF